MFRFPWTNEHELNLDWLIRTVKGLLRRVKKLEDAEHDGVVTSVNGSTGDVVIPIPLAFNGTPAALGTAAPGSSEAFARGDHVHSMPSATNVGAIPAPSSPATGAFLVWDGNAWTAQTPSIILLNPANGGIVPTNKMTLIAGNFFMNVKNGYVALTMRIKVNGTWMANQPNVVATLPQSTIDVIGQTSVNTLCKIGNSQIGTVNINTWGGANTISITPPSAPASNTEIEAAFITFPVT